METPQQSAKKPFEPSPLHIPAPGDGFEGPLPPPPQPGPELGDNIDAQDTPAPRGTIIIGGDGNDDREWRPFSNNFE